MIRFGDVRAEVSSESSERDKKKKKKKKKSKGKKNKKGKKRSKSGALDQRGLNKRGNDGVGTGQDSFAAGVL